MRYNYVNTRNIELTRRAFEDAWEQLNEATGSKLQQQFAQGMYDVNSGRNTGKSGLVMKNMARAQFMHRLDNLRDSLPPLADETLWDSLKQAFDNYRRENSSHLDKLREARLNARLEMGNRR